MSKVSYLSQYDMMQQFVFLFLLSVSTVSVGRTVFGRGKSGMRMGSLNSVFKQLNQLTSAQNCTYGELAGSALDLEQLLSPLSPTGCQIFKLSQQIPLQLSPGKPLHECLIGS